MVTTTSFIYSSSIPFAATVDNATTSFTPSRQTAALGCFYVPVVPDVNKTQLIEFLTAGSSSGSTMGLAIKDKIQLGTFVDHLNSISQLDKKWATTTAELTNLNFYNAFFEAVEKIDYDFTGLIVNDQIQFIFNYVATVTGDLPSTIVPTSSALNVHTFRVGVTFKIDSLA